MGLSFWLPCIFLLLLYPTILIAGLVSADGGVENTWREYFLTISQINLPFCYVIWLVAGQKARMQSSEAEVLASTSRGSWLLERRFFLGIYMLLCLVLFALADLVFTGLFTYVIPCLVALFFIHSSCLFIFSLLNAAMPVYLYAFLLCFIFQYSFSYFPSWLVPAYIDPLGQLEEFIPFLVLSVIFLGFLKRNYSWLKQRQFSGNA